ncbi:MAG: hypothetical protein K2Q22_16285 [Cytophagales bacterium]|nr:hypothetical protein [Cytophagales bacterium]
MVLISASLFAQKSEGFEKWEHLTRDLVLVGANHPFFPSDNITLSRIGDSLVHKSPYISSKATFTTGKELLEILKYVTIKHGSIGKLVIMGHSGYQGYFVEHNAGFYRDQYQIIERGKMVQLNKESRNIRSMEIAIKNKKVKFGDDAVIVLAGCNTAFGERNMALDLMLISNTVVLGTKQKIDLYNVSNLGEDMKGEEDGGFAAYLPKGKEVLAYFIKKRLLSISEAISIIEAKKSILSVKSI